MSWFRKINNQIRTLNCDYSDFNAVQCDFSEMQLLGNLKHDFTNLIMCPI